MIAVSVCFALGVESKDSSARIDNVTAEMLSLVNCSIAVLDRIGSQPSHGRGVGSL